MVKGILLGLSLVISVATACSDDGLTTPVANDVVAGELPLADTPVTDTPVPADVPADVLAEVGTPDTATPDAATPDAGLVDVATPDVPEDKTPPTVINTAPAQESHGVTVPFTVTVIFDEPISPNTIAASTVRLFGPDDKEVAGTPVLNPAGDTVTFTPAPESELHHLSPYRIVLSKGIISDMAGNKLKENFELTFYTSDFPNTAGYMELAAKYSPTLHSAINPGVGSVQTQIPVAFDADGDWDGSNNQKWVQSQADVLSPAIYYHVVESQTHYFIQTLFFFPWVNHPQEIYAHSNGASGAVVVVEKARGETPERPIAVTTYFKKGQYEEHYAYVTTESGIKGPKASSFYGLMGVYDQATLFPSGHYDALITAGRHESCLYLKKDLTVNCEFEVPYEIVLPYQGGAATDVTKEGGWPKEMADFPGEPASIAYGMINVLDSLWIRRNKVGENAIWGGTFKYDSGDGQPGNGMEMPNLFVDSLDELDPSFGRPLWAWRHKPSQGALSGVGDGQFGVDPAGYYMKRHASIDEDTALVPFDAVTGAGFSTQYCFNAILGIDNRETDPACGAENP
jgi:hypothetical protein